MPDFSDCLQFDPEQRTAEAAAARKRVSKDKICSSFVADLNGYRVTQDMLRHPQGTPFFELVKAGDTVRTSYGTGPYIIKAIIPCLDYSVQTYSIVCKGGYHLNELVAVNGRILHLFLANEDECFITETPLSEVEERDGKQQSFRFRR